MSEPVIGLVLKGYPRLSETFIAQEILELERAGFAVRIVSLRRPTDKAVHPVHREIRAKIDYLPEYLHEEPLRVVRAWLKSHRLPGYRAARAAFLADLRRDFTRNRLRRFGQALVLAAELPADIALLYAHFIHTPCSTARYAARMRGLRYAISAHAKDIWTTPGWELSEKLAECEWCVTCTRSGRDELARHAADPGKVRLVYHGVDLSRFPAAAPPREGAGVFRLLTVGRAVEKKGIDTLIDALALLPAALDWRWTHIGGGPLRAKLQQQADRLGLSDRCRFLGGRPQEEVIAAYRDSDVFVLPCRIDRTGDRDGLPNVIVEAQLLGLPVISTPVTGVTELVEDGRNGLLTPSDDPAALAGAILTLAGDPGLRSELGKAGAKRVRATLDHRAAIGELIGLLRGTLDLVRTGGP